MKQQFQNARQAIQAEAMEWVLQLDEQRLDRPTRGELLAWLKTSPLHVDEFLMASAVWRDLDNIDADRQADIDQLLAEAEDNVVALNTTAAIAGSVEPATSHPSKGRRRTFAWASSIVASILIAVAT